MTMTRVVPPEGIDVGVILAAGASTRMGSKPKALLALGEEDRRTFLERITYALQRGGCGLVVVVGGCHVGEIAAALPERTLLAYNRNWKSGGQLESAKVGLRAALDLCARRFVLHLVDHPLIQKHDVQNVLGAVAPRVAAVAANVGVRGHPVAFDRDTALEVCGYKRYDGRPATLREALDKAVKATVLVDASPGCVLGANNREELARLREYRAPMKNLDFRARQGARALPGRRSSS